MSKRRWAAVAAVLLGSLWLAAPPDGQGQPPPREFPPGPGGPGGFGGPMGGEVRKVVKDFDKDGDGRLNAKERVAARESLKKNRGPGGPGGPGGRGPGMGGFGAREPAKPGPKVKPEDVKAYPGAGLYEPTVLRTFFLEFETKDWEEELADFYHTDVEVPATLTVDGKQYPNVGVHFRGMSSYGMVPAGHKRSLNLSMDFVDPKQRLFGYKTLNLLNCNGDPSFLSTALYSHLARRHIPAPKANFVKVAINGESWGLYANEQQFNKEFVEENYKTSKGDRWKVKGSPGGGGGLDYLGDRVEDYKRRYQIKSEDNEKAWKALVELCKTLNQTPAAKLEAALKPMLDLDSVLWFLALDAALLNSDGYWIRASDYSLFRDAKGVFHVIPHDMNEAFQPGMGGPGGPGGFGGFGGPPQPGQVLAPPLQEVLKLSAEQKKQLEELQKEVDGKLGKIFTEEQKKQFKEMQQGGGRGPGGPGGPGAGPRSGGLELDPLVGLDDARKPLRSKLLAVPSLKTRYLQHMHMIAQELEWKNLGPVVAQYRKLIEKEVEADTRKLSTYDAFKKAVADTAEAEGTTGRRPGLSLRAFADQRSKFLLNHPEVKKAATPEGSKKEEKKP